MTTNLNNHDAPPPDAARTERLEALYAALQQHQRDPRNATWRPVLEAFRAVDQGVADACRLAALRADEGRR